MVWLRDFFTRNLGYKGVSLLFAVTFWAWVQSEERVEERMKVPVTWKLPDGLTLLEAPLESAFVTVEGVQASVRALRAAKLAITVDLHTATEGEVQVELSDRSVENLPAQVRVKEIQPASLKLMLDRIQSRRVRVTAATRGEPAAGYKLVSVKVEPERVDLVGPGSVLQTLSEVKTDAVDVNGLRDDAEFEVGLALKKDQLRPEKTSHIKVKVSIAAMVKERKVEAVPVTIDVPGWRTAVTTVSVTLNGPVDVVEKVDPTRLSARIIVPEGTEPGAEASWGPAQGLRLEISGVEGVDITAVEPDRAILEKAE